MEWNMEEICFKTLSSERNLVVKWRVFLIYLKDIENSENPSHYTLIDLIFANQHQISKNPSQTQGSSNQEGQWNFSSPAVACCVRVHLR